MRKIEEWIPNRKAKQLFAAVRRKGTGMSKFDLLDSADGLAGSTLTRLLEELNANGWIEESGRGESSGGRRPLLYQLRPQRAYAFGLDIARVTTRLVLCDLRLEQLDAVSWPMTEQMTPTALLEQVAEAVARMMKKHHLTDEHVIGIGVGAVGPVNREAGMILNPEAFPAAGWTNVPIVATLEQLLDIPVQLDNGVHTALLAEYWLDAPHYQHVLYVRAGIGLRSAMMSAGRLVYGTIDAEGSLGHMIIQTDGPPHPTRPHMYGCLESFVSIPVLEQQAMSRMRQGRRTLLHDLVERPEQVRFHHLLQALSMDDRLVTELVTQSATYFGIGLANLINLMHPETVILGGPLITTNELFYQISTQVALQNAISYPMYPLSFTRGKLSDDAPAVGAAAMMVDALSR